MRKVLLVATFVVAVAGAAPSPALASGGFERSAWTPCTSETAPANPWAVNWTRSAELAPALAAVDFGMPPGAVQSAQGKRRPVAFEYSEGYKVRAKIHKVASIATLPLFIAEYFVGANLYDNPGTASDSARGAHTALAASTAVLFGINSVTGVWNMVEARKDPSHSKRRTIHGILMLVADAGFVATGATAPHYEHEGGNDGGGDGGSRSTHRAIALTSMGIATVSYLMMLFGAH